MATQDDKVFDKVTGQEFEAAMMNNSIVAVHRKGKHLWFEMRSQPYPTFHFGMSGAFIVCGENSTTYKR